MLVCLGCGEQYDRREGIWRCLPSGRQAAYGEFLREYSTIRSHEGWGRHDPEYYINLPEVARDDPQRAIWDVRARTFRALTGRVLEPLERGHAGVLKVLDLGAGNCWLAFRLAARGHEVMAIDLSADELDGLGAHIYHGDARRITLVQAEFDRLPLAGKQAELVIFNGSIHYSTDFRATLSEATRVLQPGGRVVVMDSPVYQRPDSGREMVRDREQRYMQLHGFPSNALPTESFLTWSRVQQLGAETGLAWTIITPRLGVRSKTRRWKARIMRAREPAAFPLIVGRLDRPGR